MMCRTARCSPPRLETVREKVLQWWNNGCNGASAAVAGECFGKAGSYGIQGPAMQFVTGIQGDFFNVMGFPVNAFSRRIGKLVEARAFAPPS